MRSRTAIIARRTLSIVVLVGLLLGCSGAATSGSRSPSNARAAATQPPPFQSAAASPSGASSPLIGTWTRMNSCDDFVAALVDAGLASEIAEWVLGLEPDASTPPDPCAGLTDVPHSHFFTAGGQFGSLSETGQRVDDGLYTDTARILTFPTHSAEFGYSPIDVEYVIDGDALTFHVIIPDPCEGACRKAMAWAISAFYRSDPWIRQ